jgi:hypothetical protein
MKILISLEHTVAGDILSILRRLPFQPHFLKDFEDQLEKMVATESVTFNTSDVPEQKNVTTPAE